MRSISFCVVGFLFSIVMSNPILAETGKSDISFLGTLRASPCIVDNDEVEFDFGDVNINDFPVTGPWIQNAITFSNCPESTSKIQATFKGQPSEDDPVYGYKNSGSAKNVSILLDKSGANIGLGNGRTCEIDIANNQAKLLLSARLKKAQGATPGSIQAQVQVTFTYH
ncbi:fimbrial protein [Aeromonas dhakensis]|uniref:fimbrial protein n=1 Tax=Aeromonas dhakensis TaxID=196024 RepID=UPI00342CF898